jgi:DNA polymerase-3 subunit delta
MTKPVYALVGKDSFLQAQAIERIAGEMPPEASRVDFDGEVAELSSVLEHLREMSMFGGCRLVVLRNATEFLSRGEHIREAMERYCLSPAPPNVLVMRCSSLPSVQKIYKAIAKTGEIIPCVPPEGPAAVQWVMDRASRAHGLKMGRDAAAVLIELVGTDLGRLDNELAKLALSPQAGAITEAVVRESAGLQREMDLEEMLRELSRGDAAGAVRRWRQLLQTTPGIEFRAAVYLMNWLDGALQVAGGNFRAVAWKFKGVEKEIQQTVRKLGTERLGRLMRELALLDGRSKQGLGEMPGNIERLLVEFAIAERA